jgi:hypothetical protein
LSSSLCDAGASLHSLILRSDLEIASRRMLQLVPELPGASFETPLSRLLRMRVWRSGALVFSLETAGFRLDYGYQ